MRRLSFPVWLGPALLTGLVILLAAITDGGQAFAVFMPLEREGFWWLSIPAMTAGLIAMAWFSYLAITTRSLPSLVGISLIALAFLLASWAYVKPMLGVDENWTLMAKAIRAVLPTGGGVAAGVAFGLVMRARQQETQKQEEGQWRLLGAESERDKARANLLAEQNERYRLQTERKVALLEAEKPSATRTVTRTVKEEVRGGSLRASKAVRQMLAQAQERGLDVQAYSERQLALTLPCTTWTARQVKLLASGRLQ